MKKTALALALAVVAVCGCHNPGTGKKIQEKTDSTAVAEGFSRKNLPEEPIFDIATSKGTITVRLYSKTPRHRDNFAKLAQSHFYDSTRFHRVINGFMIQGGDPWSRDTSRRQQWGQGGPGYTVPAEFVNEYYHKKGALAAARKGDIANPTKASSGSQFYIVQDEMNCLHLDGQYTIFGETIKGFEVIDRIARAPVDNRDCPVTDIRIYRISPNWTLMKKEWEEKQAADTLKKDEK